MKINSNSKLIGTNVILVPYESFHVPKYHLWMKSEELQQLTASEPLSLEEEYQMQKSWRDDDNKCTFIILDKHKYHDKENEVDAMVGDTNIFLIDQNNSDSEKHAEIEIMIADDQARGKKYGWEAVILMLLYSISYLSIKKYEAKISIQNKVSIKLFEKLGFQEISRSDVFQEITFSKIVNNDWISWLQLNVKFEIKPYNESYI